MQCVVQRVLMKFCIVRTGSPRRAMAAAERRRATATSDIPSLVLYLKERRRRFQTIWGWRAIQAGVVCEIGGEKARSPFSREGASLSPPKIDFCLCT